jgi:hypothetical protein
MKSIGNHHLQWIIRGINRFHAKPNKKEQLPITRCLRIGILTLLDGNEPRDANIYSAFCIAHAGFLRVGEISLTGNDIIHGHMAFAQWNLTQRSIQFAEDRLLLTLPSSNTDPFHKEVTIRQLASNYATCPFTAVRHPNRLCPS